MCLINLCVDLRVFVYVLLVKIILCFSRINDIAMKERKESRPARTLLITISVRTHGTDECNFNSKNGTRYLAFCIAYAYPGIRLKRSINDNCMVHGLTCEFKQIQSGTGKGRGGVLKSRRKRRSDNEVTSKKGEARFSSLGMWVSYEHCSRCRVESSSRIEHSII